MCNRALTELHGGAARDLDSESMAGRSADRRAFFPAASCFGLPDASVQWDQRLTRWISFSAETSMPRTLLISASRFGA